MAIMGYVFKSIDGPFLRYKHVSLHVFRIVQNVQKKFVSGILQVLILLRKVQAPKTVE